MPPLVRESPPPRAPIIEPQVFHPDYRRARLSFCRVLANLSFSGNRIVMTVSLCITQNVGVPLTPKGTNMELIKGCRLALHAPGGVDPIGTAGAKTQLSRFHGFDVVGMSETSRAEEAQKIFQPPVEQASGFPVRREGLDRDLHIVVSHGFKIAQANSRDVMQGK